MDDRRDTLVALAAIASCGMRRCHLPYVAPLAAYDARHKARHWLWSWSILVASMAYVDVTAYALTPSGCSPIASHWRAMGGVVR